MHERIIHVFKAACIATHQQTMTRMSKAEVQKFNAHKQKLRELIPFIQSISDPEEEKDDYEDLISSPRTKQRVVD